MRIRVSDGDEIVLDRGTRLEYYSDLNKEIPRGRPGRDSVNHEAVSQRVFPCPGIEANQ
jgi:hypothetical protein